MASETKEELILLAKEWVRIMPEPPPSQKGLLGFTGPIGFICVKCAGKIVERGCNLKKFASTPVWEDQVDLKPKCEVCV